MEMASRLVYMKSAMLLPKYEDEGENLKRELTGQLLEYQACREAASMLAENGGGTSCLPHCYGAGTGYAVPASTRTGRNFRRLSFGAGEGQTKNAAAQRSIFRHCKTKSCIRPVTDSNHFAHIIPAEKH